jgi:ribosomal protein S18 acetylase RimI-like enzyme
MTVVVRPAVASDAGDIARVHIAAWHETYTRLLPPGAFATLDDDLGARTSRWAGIIGDDVTIVHVAEVDGELVGWASSSAGRHEERPRDLELEGLYVLARHHGSGVGQALLDAALGTRPAYLWVAADNPRAQAFYRRNGFTPDGATDEHTLVGHPLPALRFVR